MSWWSLLRAPTERSKCRRCKGTLKFGEAILRENCHASDNWGTNLGSYHLDCGVLSSRTRKYLKPINSMRDVRLHDDGYDNLNEKLKAVLELYYEEKKKKIPGPSKTLQNACIGKERRDELEDKYSSMKIPELKECLKRNQVPISGTKPELVARCVEGEGMGVPPMCPTCGKARLKTQRNGKFKCFGHFDTDSRTFMKCDFAGTAERIPWIHGNNIVKQEIKQEAKQEVKQEVKQEMTKEQVKQEIKLEGQGKKKPAHKRARSEAASPVPTRVTRSRTAKQTSN